MNGSKLTKIAPAYKSDAVVAEIVTLKTDGKEIQIPVDLIKLTGLSVEANLAAQKMVIKNDEDASKATDLVSVIVRHKKDAEERRKEIVTPFNDFADRVNALFKPIRLSLENSERIIKEGILSYRKERERLRQEEETRRRIEFEKAQKREDKAAAKEGRLPDAIVAPLPIMPQESTVKGSIGSASERKTWKAQIVDPKLVPFDYYLMPDVQEALQTVLNVTARATKGGLSIQGVKFYQEEGLSIR